MDNLEISKTKSTLGINFNAQTGVMEFTGSSFPENAIKFFDPLIKWIQDYMLNVTGKITVNFRFDYLNSSSIKYISDIVDKIEFYHTSGAEAVINWYYDENDEDVQEMGEDFKEDVTLPFNIIMN